MVVSKHLYIFQIVIAILRGTDNKESHYDILLIVGIKRVNSIIICIPMTAADIVIKCCPCRPSINGIRHTKMCGAA